MDWLGNRWLCDIVCGSEWELDYANRFCTYLVLHCETKNYKSTVSVCVTGSTYPNTQEVIIIPLWTIYCDTTNARRRIIKSWIKMISIIYLMCLYWIVCSEHWTISNPLSGSRYTNIIRWRTIWDGNLKSTCLAEKDWTIHGNIKCCNFNTISYILFIHTYSCIPFHLNAQSLLVLGDWLLEI